MDKWGTLTASNTGTLLMGNNSMLQIGGAHLGGLDATQQGGSSGILSVGDLKTSSGATDATIWMFGSSTTTAKLYADSIDLEADRNNFNIASAGASELAGDIYVKNNMTIINKSGVRFSYLVVQLLMLAAISISIQPMVVFLLPPMIIKVMGLMSVVILH
ncbi:hypothetical protein O0544_20885 [Edwardsiella anguillarum]|nr:hypothetical protein [Edwardsiella anguillarum]